MIKISAGTLCALIYPPFFEMVTFWEDWKVRAFQQISVVYDSISLVTNRETVLSLQTMLSRKRRCCKIALNLFVMTAGVLCIAAGEYT